MTLPYIKPQKGSEIVMEHIKRQITTGEYEPGAKLPTVVNLAAKFEVGRSTIREALSALKAMGYIEIRHGGGTFVRKQLPLENPNGDRLIIRTESLREVLEVRRFIESGCAALAAVRRTDEDLRAMEDILARMETSLSDEQAGEQADVEFHMQIAAASRNSLLIEMMASLTQRLQDSMKESRQLWFFSEQAPAVQLLQEHRSSYEAIRDRQEARASERIIQHISKVDLVLGKLMQTE